MTQQPYYGTPQDPYSPQPAQQYPPPGYQQVPNGYAPAPQGYAPNPYGQAPVYPPQQPYPGQQNPQHQEPPAPVGAKGNVGDFYKQPVVGGGKAVSWNNKPDGYTYIGVINRTPGDGDLFQDSDPKTKQLKTWNDGSPRMVMPVPLDLVHTDQWQAQEYRDGLSKVMLRGEMLKEWNRAMEEVGIPAGTVPQKGALVFVTITGRKPGGNIPTNVYSVRYLPAGTWEQDPQYAGIVQALAGRQAQQHAPAPQQAPYQQQASPAGNYAAQNAVPAGAQPNPQQYAQPQYGAAPAYDPNQYQQAPAQPIYQAAPQEQYSSPVPAAPVQYAPNPQQAPVQGQLPGMPPVAPQAPAPAGAVGAPDPHKAALIAQLQGHQQAPNPQQ